MSPTALTAVVFAASLTLLLLKPRRVPDWAAAVGGGLLMVVMGLISIGDAARLIASEWNLFLFFLGLGISSATADRAGVFRAAAGLAVRWAAGDQRRLLVGLFLVGVLVTAVLSNDATALLLTPVVFAIATRAGVDPRPYAFACALVANAASFVLPVSNPSNLIVLSRAPLELRDFLQQLLPASILALAVTLVGLLLVFRNELSVPFDKTVQPERVDPQAKTIGLAVCGLGLLYLLGAAAGWPLGVVALVGAVALVGLYSASRSSDARALARDVPWGLFPLFTGLLLLVAAGERAGLFSPLEQLVLTATSLNAAGPPILTLALAVLANLINNLPAALVIASSLGMVQPEVMRGDLATAAIVGVNLGPNLTTVGSLATMLWLLLLRRHGVEISVLGYLRVGVTITVPALVAATLGVWLALR